jgi:hypothetical protein
VAHEGYSVIVVKVGEFYQVGTTKRLGFSAKGPFIGRREAQVSKDLIVGLGVACFVLGDGGESDIFFQDRAEADPFGVAMPYEEVIVGQREDKGLEVFQHRLGGGFEAVAVFFYSFAGVEVALGFAVGLVGGGLEEVFVFGAGPEDRGGGYDPEGDALATAGVLLLGQDQGHIGVWGMERPHMLDMASPSALDKDFIGGPLV